jgi:tetratricopeptide (TPR) repeat protein
VCTLGGTFLAAPGQQIEKAQRYYEQGLAFAQEHRYHEATEQFAKAIEVNPEFGDAYYQLGINAVSDGKAQDGIRAFMQLAQLEPNRTEPVLAAAQLYYGLGFMEDALALSVRALLIEPNNPSIYFNIGLIYVKQKQLAPAIEALEHAVALKPEMSKARLLLANTYVAGGKPESAINTLQEGLKLNPQSPELMISLGDADVKGGHLVEAENEFRASIAVRESVGARIGLARVYRLQHRYPEAIAEMTSLLQKQPNALDARLELGVGFYESGDRQAAMREFEAFSHAQPDRAEGYYYLGLIDLDENRVREAVAYLKQALEFAPGNCESQTKLAKAYLALGELPAADDSLNGCVDAMPQNAAASQLRDEIRRKRGEAGPP